MSPTVAIITMMILIPAGRLACIDTAPPSHNQVSVACPSSNSSASKCPASMVAGGAGAGALTVILIVMDGPELEICVTETFVFWPA